MRIYLDLDGVLLNFHKAYCDLIKKPELYDNWPKGKYLFTEVLNITENEFWDSIPPGFFSTLPIMSDYSRLLALVRMYDLHFDICTSPGKSRTAAQEKLDWIHNQFGITFTDYHITGNKIGLAKPGNVLITDWDQESYDFAQAGGFAIIIPRLWNSRYNLVNQSIPVVDIQLQFAQSLKF